MHGEGAYSRGRGLIFGGGDLYSGEGTYIRGRRFTAYYPVHITTYLCVAEERIQHLPSKNKRK